MKQLRVFTENERQTERARETAVAADVLRLHRSGRYTCRHICSLIAAGVPCRQRMKTVLNLAETFSSRYETH